MMKRYLCVLALATGMMVWSQPARASLILFEANLDPLQEVPPNPSPASGFGSVLLDDVLDTITVDLTFAGLLAPSTAAHIHGSVPPGVNGPVLFPLLLGPAGGLTSGSILTQVFAITPAQIANLEAGLFYMNVHSLAFPGGEIRGQLLPAVPEPATLTLLGSGVLCLAYRLRRRRRT